MSDYRPMVSPELRSILSSAAQRHGITVQQLQGSGHQAPQMAARVEVAIELRANGWSYPRIASVLGYENQTSVQYLVKYRHKRRRANHDGMQQNALYSDLMDKSRPLSPDSWNVHLPSVSGVPTPAPTTPKTAPAMPTLEEIMTDSGEWAI